MAPENLNRAFIKAYGKGKSANTNTAATDQLSDSQNPWIVRFDTATVPASVVPQMHNQRPPTHEIQMAKPTCSPAPKSDQQMRVMQANSNLRQPTPSPTALSVAETLLPSADAIAQYFAGSTMVVHQANLNLGSSLGSDKQPNLSSAREQAAPTFEPLTAPTTAQASKSKFVATTRESPDGPRAETPTYVRSESASPRPFDPSELEQKIAAKNRSGEIFRLDRPSYAPEQVASDVFADDQQSSPSDVVSMTAVEDAAEPGAPESASSPWSPKGVDGTSAGISTPPVQNQQAIAKERDLRQARGRIFNPLWEVDRLEWPRVCVELLNSIDAKSTGVAANLLNACQDGLQVLAVTSPQSGTGTSTVACCLAMIAGRHGLNIALVDGNMENPSLCYQTNLELEVDWHEAVARKMPLEEIAVHSVDDQVTLVPLLARLSAPQLNEQNMAKMLSELSQSFDLVVVDLGNMATSRNLVTALGDLGAINAVVAVVDRRNSSAERIESCLRQIRQTGIASIGLVENFAA